jgi:hypothetical protein
MGGSLAVSGPQVSGEAKEKAKHKETKDKEKRAKVLQQIDEQVERQLNKEYTNVCEKANTAKAKKQGELPPTRDVARIILRNELVKKHGFVDENFGPNMNDTDQQQPDPKRRRSGSDA